MLVKKLLQLSLFIFHVFADILFREDIPAIVGDGGVRDAATAGFCGDIAASVCFSCFCLYSRLRNY